MVNRLGVAPQSIELGTGQSVWRFGLRQGITLLVVHNPSVDIVASRFFFPGGSRVESPAQAGVGTLTAAVLTKGTENLDSHTIATQIESMGAIVTTDCSLDHFEVGLKCIASDFTELFQLVADMLQAPLFPEVEVLREQDLLIQAIRSQQERPFSIAFSHLRQALYGNHPYALSTLGEVQTVESLTRQDLLTYFQTHCHPRHLVITVVSPFLPERVAEQIESTLENWSSPKVTSLTGSIHPWPDKYPPEVLKTPQETQQSIMMWGYRGSSVHSPDYGVLKLLASYLGGGLSSRLFVELREKQGLAYEVSAFYGMRQDPAPFVAYIGTAAENTALALDRLQNEMQRVTHTILSDLEVTLTQRKLLGQYALAKQTNSQVAQLLGLYEVLGLGVSFDRYYPEMLRAVDPADIYRVAQAYLKDPVVSIVGPACALELL
jgi:predicted Zn-dependent peptidase